RAVLTDTTFTTGSTAPTATASATTRAGASMRSDRSITTCTKDRAGSGSARTNRRRTTSAKSRPTTAIHTGGIPIQARAHPPTAQAWETASAAGRAARRTETATTITTLIA